MTVEQIIKQTETLTKDQKQQLAFYILFSTMSEDKRSDLLQLFFYENNFDSLKISKDKKKQKEKPVFGIFKDKLKTPDNFNEPLEDLKDYM